MPVRSLALLVTLLLGTTVAQGDERFIIRVNSGRLDVVQSACRIAGCSIVRSLGDPTSELFLLSVTNRSVVSLLERLSRNALLGIEADTLVSIVENGTGPGAAPLGLSDRTPANVNGDTVWNGYGRQPAANVVRLEEGRKQSNASGGGVVVAVIDTGVDPFHPALRRVLVPGYDFTRDQSGMGSEMGDVNQSTAAVVDGAATPVRVNGSTIAVVNQSTAAVVDDRSHAAFGHGTMVAGIIHLAAPQAHLMSLKAFRSDGTGYVSDVLRAVYHAVQNNAKVVNMSFSMTGPSRELERAINHAAASGVICVGSAGNNGSTAVVYPAGLPNVMAVASTDLNDRRSSFSNYGARYIWVAAPGEGIVTTYPFGSYAAGSGTSFSTPWVSGTAALLAGLRPSLNQGSAAQRIADAKPVGRELGNGRLDVAEALSMRR